MLLVLAPVLDRRGQLDPALERAPAPVGRQQGAGRRAPAAVDGELERRPGGWPVRGHCEMICRALPCGQRGASEELAEGITAEAAPLLEREGDLAALGAALSRARGGSGRVVLVEAPAGSGKTRLLGEAGARARRLGFEVLTARGGPLERGHGFGVVLQLLETAVARASPQERDELFAGAARLAEPVLDPAAAATADGADTTRGVLHGLYWLVANLAERGPLLLAVDDVHWADEASLRYLLYLARRLDGVPVALVLAARSGEPRGGSEELRALRLEAHPPVLRPGALSAAATATLTAARLGRDPPAGLVSACHEATLGNPFLLTELLAQLRSQPEDIDPGAVARSASERITAAILMRIGTFGPQAAALARAVAVLGATADIEAAAALADLDATTAAGLADELARAEILAPDELRFVHPLVGAAVYEDMLRSQRAALHARAAHAAGSVDAAATHLLRAEPAADPRSVALLRGAAGAALSRGAPESAVAFLRRAAREPPPEQERPAFALELGMAAARAGEPDGVELLEQAFALTAGQPERARAGLELAFALGVSSGRWSDAIDVLERAREGLADGRLHDLVDARLTMLAILVPSARERLAAHLDRARAAIDRPAGPEATHELLAVLSGDLLHRRVAAADAVRLAERAVAGGALMRRDVELDTEFGLVPVAVLVFAGELDGAQRHVEAGIAYARERGSAFALARLTAYRALVRWRRGELPAAESDALAALGVDAAWGIPHAVSSAVLAQARIERGDLDGARDALQGPATDPAALVVTENQVVREARAALAMADGRPGDALAELRECARWEELAGVGEDVLGPVAWRPGAARAQLALGAEAEARALAGEELRLARAFGAAPRTAVALRALGLAEGGADGIQRLEEAVALLAPTAARLDHAYALVELGALLRRRGQRSAATERLRAGMALAHGCCATALVDAAAAELRLAGARPRRIAVSGRAALTPGELRVADLAAQGMSNKQIAQALFVTMRTVEMHLSNAYRKLAIGSREELPAALG